MPKRILKIKSLKEAIALLLLGVAVAFLCVLYLAGFVREMGGKSKSPNWKETVHVKGQIQPGLKVPQKTEEAH